MKNVKGGGFITYIRAMKNLLFKSGFNLHTYIILLFAAALFLVLNQIRTGERVEVIMLYNLFIALLLFSGEWARLAKDGKPGLLSLYPQNYKRKAVFGCLGILVTALSLFAFVILTLFLIFILPVLFASCVVVNLSLMSAYLENFKNFAVQFNAQGFMFLALYALFVYGLAIILSSMKKFRWRLTLCAFLTVGSALMMTAFYFSVKDIGLTESESVWALFDRVPLSGLWIALSGGAAAVALTVGIILNVKRGKPKLF